MATTKTAKKSTPVKASIKSKTKTSAKSTSAFKSFRSMNVSDLRNKIMSQKNRKSLILGAVVVGLGALLVLGRSYLIAATVNGEPISRLSIIQELEKQSGKAVIDSKIMRMLVFQEAEKKNVTATDKEIDAEISKIQKQFQDQGQNLDTLLAAQGLSKEKFREEVKIQVLVTKLLGDQAKVTDKEFDEFLAKNQDLLTNETDKEKATAGLRQQMEQQKLAQKYQEWIANLRKNAKIQYLVNY